MLTQLLQSWFVRITLLFPRVAKAQPWAEICERFQRSVQTACGVGAEDRDALNSYDIVQIVQFSTRNSAVPF